MDRFSEALRAIVGFVLAVAFGYLLYVGIVFTVTHYAEQIAMTAGAALVI